VAGRYYEDFHVGEVIDSPETYEITRERLHAFADEFDPQPMHLDEAAAKASVFGRLVASGWQTLSVTMRLMVRSPLFESGEVVGVGIDKLRWLAPVEPGDVLRARAEVLSMRESSSRPGQGYMTVLTQAFVGDKPVTSMETTMMVPRRPTGE
jgi:acyl dehydratase